jgi:hypothetical protein
MRIPAGDAVRYAASSAAGGMSDRSFSVAV